MKKNEILSIFQEVIEGPRNVYLDEWVKAGGKVMGYYCSYIPEEIFTELDPEPLAAASMAQVHLARLMDGTAVVIKVRRPGIRPTVEADLRLLQRLAKIIATEAPDLRHFRTQEVVRQFTLSLRRELDLAVECRNTERGE